MKRETKEKLEGILSGTEKAVNFIPRKGGELGDNLLGEKLGGELGRYLGNLGGYLGEVGFTYLILGETAAKVLAITSPVLGVYQWIKERKEEKMYG